MVLGSAVTNTEGTNMPQRLRGQGSIYRDELPIGLADYALNIRVAPIDISSPAQPYDVVYGHRVEGTLTLVEGPSLVVGDEVRIVLVNGSSYHLWVTGQSTGGAQQVMGVAIDERAPSLQHLPR
jgi:hypothetical protein